MKVSNSVEKLDIWDFVEDPERDELFVGFIAQNTTEISPKYYGWVAHER